jgi:hypothetical protein
VTLFFASKKKAAICALVEKKSEAELAGGNFVSSRAAGNKKEYVLTSSQVRSFENGRQKKKKGES